MKKIFYLSTALILCGMAQSQASCIQTPSCTSLGYTKTSSCTNGLKCPFGNYWYCPEKTTQENCSNYTYVCSGTGYAGGAGTACNGKYSSCTCANGYEWQNGQCKRNVIWGKCSGYAANCKIGNILFSDGTCNARMVSGKTAIAIVVYISNEGCGQAMALNSSISWKPAFNSNS